eukprot:431732-Amphidinium_carterae.1
MSSCWSGAIAAFFLEAWVARMMLCANHTCHCLVIDHTTARVQYSGDCCEEGLLTPHNFVRAQTLRVPAVVPGSS